MNAMPDPIPWNATSLPDMILTDYRAYRLQQSHLKDRGFVTRLGRHLMMYLFTGVDRIWAALRYMGVRIVGPIARNKTNDKAQSIVRKFVEENMTLEREAQWLKQVILQERSYSQMLITLNNATQNLFATRDRKVLLKKVTSSLCEDLGYTSAILWVVDKDADRLVPMSWSNVPLESINRLDVKIGQRPYSDLVEHRKSYFLVDDDCALQTESPYVRHMHELRHTLNSDVIFLIPIVSIDDPEDMVENCQSRTRTNAILMVGQKDRKRVMESKDLLQRYAYAVGLTLGHVDVYHYLHENYRNYKRQAITDGLTGLYNRRFFNEELGRELNRSVRHSLNMSLILLDVDHFKTYNDLNGHQAGDDVLKSVGTILREATRVCDMECRYGGEEFAMILPETSKAQALLIAEKLRRRVEETEFVNQESQPHGNLTISAGVATFPDDGIQAADLVRQADAGLYRAKAIGRNCVVSLKLDAEV